MDMLKVHGAALNSSNVAYNEFLLFYNRGAKVVYAFTEGKEDPSFYRNFIDTILPEGWEGKIVQAGSKRNVLELFSNMDWNRFPRKAVCFFVDRDLSEFTGGETHAGDNLYVSDKYSIENDMACSYTMLRLLEEVNGVSGLEPTAVDRIKEIFCYNLETFCEALVCIMAQILIWRRLENTGTETAITRLDSIKVRNFFSYDEGVIKIVDEFKTPESRIAFAVTCTKGKPATPEELKSAESEFREKNGREKFVRGKYIRIFFVHSAEAIRLAIPLLCSRYKTPPGNNGGLGVSNAMMILGPRIRCPASLKTFLENNYLQYISAQKAA